MCEEFKNASVNAPLPILTRQSGEPADESAGPVAKLQSSVDVGHPMKDHGMAGKAGTIQMVFY